MAKRFKFKISRVFSFQSCRSKDPSTLPSNPAPSFSRLSPFPQNSTTTTLYLPPPPHPPSKPPHYSSLKRHVSSAFSSMGCGLGSRSSSQYLSDSDYTESPPPPTPEFHWEKDHKWHVIAKVHVEENQQTHASPRVKIAESSENDAVSLPPPPPPPNTERKKRRQRKKKTTSKIRISTSSWESGSGLFSDDEEIESLVSPSRSFSTDSGSRRHKIQRSKRKVRRCVFKEISSARISSTSESESPARLSMFLQKMIPCAVEGKVRESFAVVKKSEDPFEDFKRSMMEMILEKQIFEVKDLEQLLQCFLSLNSRDHHGIIVQAFAEIWEALFCARSASFRKS